MLVCQPYHVLIMFATINKLVIILLNSAILSASESIEVVEVIEESEALPISLT